MSNETIQLAPGMSFTAEIKTERGKDGLKPEAQAPSAASCGAMGCPLERSEPRPCSRAEELMARWEHAVRQATLE